MALGACPNSEPGRLTGITRREAASSVAPVYPHIETPCVLASHHVSRVIHCGHLPDRPLVHVDRLTFTYPEGRTPALCDVSLRIEPGEKVLVLGPSGGGKSTLIRALAGLVPHFHGGHFAGRVSVAGLDTRDRRPWQLAGAVATVFQDPEDQVVMTRVAAEVAFGLENLGVEPQAIETRTRAALAAVGALHLAGRCTYELSAGELQRVCLASALAFEPRLLLLDEPSSQLDRDAAESFFELIAALDVAVVVAEQRPGIPLESCDRVLFVDGGQVLLDATREDALQWLAAERPSWLQATPPVERGGPGDVVVELKDVSFAYGERRALAGAELLVRRGEIVALTGPNGAGKTTLARLAAGLLEAHEGTVVRSGRASYLAQDPGRYVVADTAVAEVALGVDGDERQAREALASMGLAGLEARHPRDLSSGERERLAVASVLVTEPDLLILDEPTRGVDPARKAELAARLRAESPRRGTVVVTHDAAFVAAVADREVRLGAAREALRV